MIRLLIACILLVLLGGCSALCRTGDQPVIDATGRVYASACR
jgi:hypothetical protein